MGCLRICYENTVDLDMFQDCLISFHYHFHTDHVDMFYSFKNSMEFSLFQAKHRLFGLQ